MKIQSVKFPTTPEETLAIVEELRPLLDKANQAMNGADFTVPAEMLVIMWHSAQIDFVEFLDNDKRVGVAMVNLYPDSDGNKQATLMLAYLEEAYRGQGSFLKALDYMKTVYRARSVSSLSVRVPMAVNLPGFGDPKYKTYELEL